MLHAIPGVFAADGNHPFNRRRSVERAAARSPERGCHEARKIASENGAPKGTLVSLRREDHELKTALITSLIRF
jgi:hypothetical protein